MGQFSWPPNSPRGSTISLRCPHIQPPRACMSSFNNLDMLLMRWWMSSWGTWLLEQYVMSQRCSIGLMSGEQVVKWIASMSPSSRTCWPPPAAGGWALLWNDSNTQQQSALLSFLLARLLSFTLHNTRRWEGELATAKTKQAPSSIIPVVCPQMRFPKCPTSSQTCSTIRFLQCRKRFYTLESWEKKKEKTTLRHHLMMLQWTDTNTRRHGKRTGNDSYYRRRQKMSYLMTTAEMYKTWSFWLHCNYFMLYAFFCFFFHIIHRLKNAGGGGCLNEHSGVNNTNHIQFLDGK